MSISDHDQVFQCSSGVPGLVLSESIDMTSTEEIEYYSEELVSENRQFIIIGVVDPITKELISMYKAIDDGVIDESEGLYVDSVKKTSVSIDVAMSEGLIHAELIDCNRSQDYIQSYILSKTDAKMDLEDKEIVGIVDTKHQSILTVEEAQKREIIDHQFDVYLDTELQKAMPVKTAYENGLVIITNMSMVEDSNLTSCIVDYIIHPQTGRHLSMKESLRDAVISSICGEYVIDKDRSKLSLSAAVKLGLIVLKRKGFERDNSIICEYERLDKNVREFWKFISEDEELFRFCIEKVSEGNLNVKSGFMIQYDVNKWCSLLRVIPNQVDFVERLNQNYKMGVRWYDLSLSCDSRNLLLKIGDFVIKNKFLGSLPLDLDKIKVGEDVYSDLYCLVMSGRLNTDRFLLDKELFIDYNNWLDVIDLLLECVRNNCLGWHQKVNILDVDHGCILNQDSGERYSVNEAVDQNIYCSKLAYLVYRDQIYNLDYLWKIGAAKGLVFDGLSLKAAVDSGIVCLWPGLSHLMATLCPSLYVKECLEQLESFTNKQYTSFSQVTKPVKPFLHIQNINHPLKQLFQNANTLYDISQHVQFTKISPLELQPIVNQLKQLHQPILASLVCSMVQSSSIRNPSKTLHQSKLYYGQLGDTDSLKKIEQLDILWKKWKKNGDCPDELLILLGDFSGELWADKMKQDVEKQKKLKDEVLKLESQLKCAGGVEEMLNLLNKLEKLVDGSQTDGFADLVGKWKQKIDCRLSEDCSKKLEETAKLLESLKKRSEIVNSIDDLQQIESQLNNLLDDLTDVQEIVGKSDKLMNSQTRNALDNLCYVQGVKGQDLVEDVLEKQGKIIKKMRELRVLEDKKNDIRDSLFGPGVGVMDSDYFVAIKDDLEDLRLKGVSVSDLVIELEKLESELKLKESCRELERSLADSADRILQKLETVRSQVGWLSVGDFDSLDDQLRQLDGYERYVDKLGTELDGLKIELDDVMANEDLDVVLDKSNAQKLISETDEIRQQLKIKVIPEKRQELSNINTKLAQFQDKLDHVVFEIESLSKPSDDIEELKSRLTKLDENKDGWLHQLTVIGREVSRLLPDYPSNDLIGELDDRLKECNDELEDKISELEHQEWMKNRLDSRRSKVVNQLSHLETVLSDLQSKPGCDIENAIGTLQSLSSQILSNESDLGQLRFECDELLLMSKSGDLQSIDQEVSDLERRHDKFRHNIDAYDKELSDQKLKLGHIQSLLEDISNELIGYPNQLNRLCNVQCDPLIIEGSLKNLKKIKQRLKTLEKRLGAIGAEISMDSQLSSCVDDLTDVENTLGDVLFQVDESLIVVVDALEMVRAVHDGLRRGIKYLDDAKGKLKRLGMRGDDTGLKEELNKFYQKLPELQQISQNATDLCRDNPHNSHLSYKTQIFQSKLRNFTIKAKRMGDNLQKREKIRHEFDSKKKDLEGWLIEADLIVLKYVQPSKLTKVCRGQLDDHNYFIDIAVGQADRLHSFCGLATRMKYFTGKVDKISGFSHNLQLKYKRIMSKCLERQKILEQQLRIDKQFSDSYDDLVVWCRKMLDELKKGVTVGRLSVIDREICYRDPGYQLCHRLGKNLMSRCNESDEEKVVLKNMLVSLKNLWSSLRFGCDGEKQKLMEMKAKSGNLNPRQWLERANELTDPTRQFIGDRNHVKRIRGELDKLNHELNHFVELFNHLGIDHDVPQRLKVALDKLENVEKQLNQFESNVSKVNGLMKIYPSRSDELDCLMKDGLVNSGKVFVQTDVPGYMKTLSLLKDLNVKYESLKKHHEMRLESMESRKNRQLMLEGEINRITELLNEIEGNLGADGADRKLHEVEMSLSKLEPTTSVKRLQQKQRYLMKEVHTRRQNADNNVNIHQWISDYARYCNTRQPTPQFEHTGGWISKEQFLRAVSSSRYPSTATELSTVFAHFDKKHEGRISHSEFMKQLREHGQPLPEEQLISQEVHRQLSECSCPIQFYVHRETDTKYRFGSQRRSYLLRFLNSTVMVRVGGGWQKLSEFLKKHDPCRC